MKAQLITVKNPNQDHFFRNLGIHDFPDHAPYPICCTFSFCGSVKNVGVEDTPRISEPLSFFEKTLFSSAPTGVSHR